MVFFRCFFGIQSENLIQKPRPESPKNHLIWDRIATLAKWETKPKQRSKIRCYSSVYIYIYTLMVPKGTLTVKKNCSNVSHDFRQQQKISKVLRRKKIPQISLKGFRKRFITFWTKYFFICRIFFIEKLIFQKILKLFAYVFQYS